MRREVIPNITHCIWAGGYNPLPPQGVAIVSEWALSNPTGKIYLWLDERTSGKSLEELAKEYKSFFQKKGIEIFLSDNESKPAGEIPFIIIKDIGRENLRNSLVDYEIDKLEPGYGASSDLLRYAILEKKGGGIYIDCTDVHPNFPLAKTNLFDSHASHVLFVDDLAQNATPTFEQLTSFNLSTIGNDTFISSSNNPLIKAIRIAAENNYTITPEKVGEIIKYAHASHHPKVITIPRTGPGLVRAVITNQNLGILSSTADQNIIVKACPEGNVLIKKARTQEMSLTQPSKENSRLWLKAIESPRPLLSPEEALRKVLKSIDFEVEHFHYLRLEYHAETLARALSSPTKPITANEAFATITSALNQKNPVFWKQVEYVSLIGACRDTVNYCESKKLCTLFHFNKAAKEMVLQIETNQFDISLFIKDLAPILTMEKENPEKNQKSVKDAVSNIDKGIKLEVSKKITHGCRFIEFMTQNPDKFTKKEDQDDFCKLAKEILVQYNQISKLLLKAEPDNLIYQQNDQAIQKALKSTVLFGLYNHSQTSSTTSLIVKKN